MICYYIVVRWCNENGISFWAWAVLEEGMLTDPRVKTKGSIMKLIFSGKKKKLRPLYAAMDRRKEQASENIIVRTEPYYHFGVEKAR